MDVEKRPSRGTRFLSLPARDVISLSKRNGVWQLRSRKEEVASATAAAARARVNYGQSRKRRRTAFTIQAEQRNDDLFVAPTQLNSTRLGRRFMNSDTATLGSKCGGGNDEDDGDDSEGGGGGGEYWRGGCGGDGRRQPLSQMKK